jgi:lipoprotein-anchoring transpeptidase ErfK/SrfK
MIGCVGVLVSACSSSGAPATRTVTKTAANGSPVTGASTSAAGASSSSSAAAAATPVHIKLLNSDGSTYGVGMPVIAFFSKKITSAKALQDATTATVDGKPLTGAWYFEYSSYYKGYPIEAHWRPQTYWQAHSKIHLAIPAKGLSAGKGLAYDDSLTLDFSTGARNISVVNDATHKMTVTSDGKTYGTFPVSLGASKTPTAHGTKVIMEKGRSICMSGPGYHECGVKYTQRLTYGGEYLHSAPWNVSNIKNGVDSSNGCTNLLPQDAAKLYHFLNVGDVVLYPNANGPAMQLGTGYGDWNINWGAWQSGGLVSTTA